MFGASAAVGPVNLTGTCRSTPRRGNGAGAPLVPTNGTSARRNSFVKPEELDASDHDVKADDHVIMRRNRLVDLSISIKALYN